MNRAFISARDLVPGKQLDRLYERMSDELSDSSSGMSIEELLGSADGPYAQEADDWISDGDFVIPGSMAANLRDVHFVIPGSMAAHLRDVRSAFEALVGGIRKAIEAEASRRGLTFDELVRLTRK